MVVTKPYGTLEVITDYIRKVGGLASATMPSVRNSVTNDADLFMEVDPSVGIDDNYPFRPAINEWVDLKVACRIHLMYGDPLDAQYYCTEADKQQAMILAKDPNLKDNAAGHVGIPLPKTFPSNPDGIKIIGNRFPETNP